MAYRPCKHLDLKPGETARKGYVYNCLYPLPEPVFPVSVTMNYSYKWPPLRCHVEKIDCERCPLKEANGGGE